MVTSIRCVVEPHPSLMRLRVRREKGCGLNSDPWLRPCEATQMNQTGAIAEFLPAGAWDHLVARLPCSRPWPGRRGVRRGLGVDISNWIEGA
jgi:hypothetical protein